MKTMTIRIDMPDDATPESVLEELAAHLGWNQSPMFNRVAVLTAVIEEEA